MTDASPPQQPERPICGCSCGLPDPSPPLPVDGLRPLLEALTDAAEALEARELRSHGEFDVWIESRMVHDAAVAARAALSGTEPGE
jgi:hypothetical protein